MALDLHKFKSVKVIEIEYFKDFFDYIDGRYKVKTIRSDIGNVYYLSTSLNLQAVGHRLVDKGKVMYVNNCGESTLRKLFRIKKNTKV